MKVPKRINRYIQPIAPAQERPFNKPGILTREEIANLEDLIASRPRQAGVYFIQAGSAIKIGYSANVLDRILTLQTGNHENLKLLGLLKVGKESEALIQQRFEHLHLRNEWFRDDPEIRLYLLEHEDRI